MHPSADATRGHANHIPELSHAPALSQRYRIVHPIQERAREQAHSPHSNRQSCRLRPDDPTPSTWSQREKRHRARTPFLSRETLGPRLATATWLGEGREYDEHRPPTDARHHRETCRRRCRYRAGVVSAAWHAIHALFLNRASYATVSAFWDSTDPALFASQCRDHVARQPHGASQLEYAQVPCPVLGP